MLSLHFPETVQLFLTQIDELYLHPISQYLTNLHPDFPQEPDPNSSLDGSWYLSPKQHVVEYIVENVVFAVCTLVFLKSALQKGSKISFSLVQPTRTRFHTSERILYWSTAVSLLLRAYYLYNRESTIFLFQPCHLYASTILLLPLLPHRAAQVVFNTLIFILWGALLAILFPDLRDYNQFFELENFWIEHMLVMIVPCYFAITRKFTLFPFSMSFAAFAFSWFAFYHSGVLHTGALISGKNLNYVLAPPPGPLQWFGRWYRMVMFPFCFLLTIAFGRTYAGVAKTLAKWVGAGDLLVPYKLHSQNLEVKKTVKVN